MWREVLIAVLMGAVIGLFALNWGQYEYWRSWTPERFNFGFATYLGFNGGAGALGVLVAALLRWDPYPGLWAANAAVFAISGQALLRVEPRGFGLDRANAGSSLLFRGVKLVLDMLDSGVETAATEDLRQMTDARLFEEALYLNSKEFAADDSGPQQLGGYYKALIVTAGEQLANGEEGEPRGTLERFCLGRITTNALPRGRVWMRDRG